MCVCVYVFVWSITVAREQNVADVTQLVEQPKGRYLPPAGHYGGVAQATVAGDVTQQFF